MQILTICIPTYNRREYLMGTLKQIAEQSAGLENEVAIRISDNASTDGTYEAVQDFIRDTPQIGIGYSRLPINIGADRNLLAVLELPNTEWVWLMADDDVLADGAIAFMLEKTKTNSDFILTPFDIYDKQMKRKTYDFSDDKPDSLEFMGVQNEHPSIYTLLAFMGIYVFKRDKWLATKGIEKHMDSHIAQMYFALYWLGKGARFSFYNRICVHQRGGNSGLDEDTAYAIFHGCMEGRARMINETITDEKDRKILMEAFFQPLAILSFKKTEKGGILPSKRADALFEAAEKNYSWYWKFWLLYPIQYLTPPFMARIGKKIYDEVR